MKKLLVISCALISGAVFAGPNSPAGKLNTAIEQKEIGTALTILENEIKGTGNVQNALPRLMNLIDDVLQCNGAKDKSESKKGSLGLTVEQLEQLEGYTKRIQGLFGRLTDQGEVGRLNKRLSELLYRINLRLDVARSMRTVPSAAASSSEESKKAKKA